MDGVTSVSYLRTAQLFDLDLSVTLPRLFQIEVGPLTVPLPVEFCGVEYDGCRGASPACGEMSPGQGVQLCSSLTVPTESPDVSAEL